MLPLLGSNSQFGRLSRVRAEIRDQVVHSAEDFWILFLLQDNFAIQRHITCFQNVASREASSADLRAFHRKKCAVLVCRAWSSRLAHTSCSKNAAGASLERNRSYVRQPSSFLVGPTSARNSASRSSS